MSDSPFPPGAPVVCYLRDSGGPNQDLSIAQQEAVIRGWCGEHGHTLARVFADEARSAGSVVGRIQFDAMIDYLARGAPVGGVVLWDLKRFSRDLDDGHYYTGLIRRHGYQIHSIDDNIPPGSMGKIFESLQFWAGEEYRKQLSTQVTRGHDFIASTFHSLPTGKPPVGLVVSLVQVGVKRNGKPRYARRLVPDPEKAPRVLEAFELRAAGYTLREIVARSGLYPARESYAAMFRQTLYIGTLTHGGRTYPDFCEPIIPRPLWDKVQRINADTRERSAWHVPKRERSSYLLSGLARCAYCGYPLGGRTYNEGGRVTRPYHYYMCTNQIHNNGCGAQLIPAAALDDAVLEALRTFLLAPDLLKTIAAEIERERDERTRRAGSRLNDARAELKRADKATTNLLAAIRDAGHSPALLRELADTEAQAQALRQEIGELEAAHPPDAQAVPANLEAFGVEVWETIQEARNEDKRTLQLLLRSMVGTVSAARNGRSVTGKITINEIPELGQVSITVPLAN